MTNFTDLEFLDDFLDETDRHLQSVTGHLLAMEADNRPDRLDEMLDEMLRSFHTLKGLCGMVRLGPAADLSHAIESVLRAVKKAELEISAPLIDSLLDGVRMIEALIAPLRGKDAPACDTAPLLKTFAGLLPPPSLSSGAASSSSVREKNPPDAPESLPPLLSGYRGVLPEELLQALDKADYRQIQAAVDGGRHLALAIFSPSPEKVSRGVNITSVRDQLGSACRIIKAVPLVSGATIRFAFLINSETPLAPDLFPALEWIDLPPPDPQIPAPAGKPAVASSPAPLRAAPGASVRVDIARLDDLMRLIGDLVVSRSRLAETLPGLSGAAPRAVEALDMISANIERQLRELRGAVMRVRLVPLSDVFNRMPLAIRDIARESGKQIRLVLEGQETEIDKLLVDHLFDPLLHLLRNAIAHGIETPAERQAAGKPAEGVLTLGGRPEGDHIVIRVTDDGRGIDFEQTAASARALGFLDRERAPDAGELLEILCLPGFSTRVTADMGSGRGIGMDVVSRAVKSLGGTLSMQTSPGQGTAFTLRLPLTLVIIDAFIVGAGNQRFAIPQGAVSEVMELHESLLVSIEAGEIFSCRGEPLPVARLSTLFHLPADPPVPGMPRRTKIALIMGNNGSRTALVVDKVVGAQEVVVRTVTDPLVAQPGIAGATELGDGSVVLILDAAGLLRHVRQKKHRNDTEGAEDSGL